MITRRRLRPLLLLRSWKATGKVHCKGLLWGDDVVTSSAPLARESEASSFADSRVVPRTVLWQSCEGPARDG